MGYVDTKALEATWTRWNERSKKHDWKELSTGVYKICCGVATQFYPQTEEELYDLAHHAYQVTMEKIRVGKLTFIPGRAPVFNLLTTAAFRCLYTYKTTEKRKNSRLVRYPRRAFENLSLLNDKPDGRIKTCQTPLVKYDLDQKS